MGIDDIVRKAKEAATDQRIDQASEQLRKIVPDRFDRHVDTAAEQAKKHNEDAPGPDAGTRSPADRTSVPEGGSAMTGSAGGPPERVVPPNSADPGPETGQGREEGPPNARP